jgi:hypothetical protein
VPNFTIPTFFIFVVGLGIMVCFYEGRETPEREMPTPRRPQLTIEALPSMGFLAILRRLPT